MNNVIMTSLFALPSKWNNAMDGSNQQSTHKQQAESSVKQRNEARTRWLTVSVNENVLTVIKSFYNVR